MSIAEQLKKTDLFSEVDLLDLEALIVRTKEQNFDEGTVLFNAGDPGDTMYIIRSGRIRIYMHDTEGQEITLTHYGENEIFGELSPIDQRPRSASAAAAEALDVLVLYRDDFLAFLHERPQIGLAMMRSLSQRLRNTTTYLEEFKPSQFETPPVDRGESLRRGASGIVADIIDDVHAAPDLEESLRPSKLSELPKLPELTQDKPEPESSSMGIFDRITSPLEERIKKSDESEDK